MLYEVITSPLAAGDAFQQKLRHKFSPEDYALCFFMLYVPSTDVVITSYSIHYTKLYDRRTNEIFCVECKYRSKLFKGKLQWSSPKQLGRYRTFANDNLVPFFVVIGLGGKARKPKRIFCVPLEEAKYPALSPELFEKFRITSYNVCYTKLLRSVN